MSVFRTSVIVSLLFLFLGLQVNAGPLLARGDFAAAKSTFARCVELMGRVPNSGGPVAFRMPCCDSLNTPSPRFYAEIFNKPTSDGRLLKADSSVFNVTTANDPDLP